MLIETAEGAEERGGKSFFNPRLSFFVPFVSLWFISLLFLYASNSFATFPCTSVSRKSRPA